MQKKKRILGKTTAFGPNSMGMQLLDTGYNSFIKRILWAETSPFAISDTDRRDIANALLAYLELIDEAINAGAIPAEIVRRMHEFANFFDVMSREIGRYEREKSVHSDEITDVQSENTDNSGDNL